MHYSASTSVEAATDIEAALSPALDKHPQAPSIVKAAKLLAGTLGGTPVGISVIGQDDTQVEVRVWVTEHPEVEV